MKNIRLKIMICVLAIAASGPAVSAALPADFKASAPSYVSFVENRGQVGQDDVFCYAATAHGVVFVTKKGELVYALRSFNRGAVAGPAAAGQIAAPDARRFAIKEKLMASAQPRVMGEDPSAVKLSDFRGNDPARWQTDLAVYGTVNLGEVYPGIVLKLKAATDNIEKVYLVQPAADPKAIRVEIAGVDSLQVTGDGELAADTFLGFITFTKPLAYQKSATGPEPVEVAYVVNGNEYGFSVGDYDHHRELIIDPLLASTFLGGDNNEVVEDMLLDRAGNIYVTGWTGSTDFPAAIGAYDSSFNGYLDLYVAKFDGDLQNLLACTYIGGSHNEQYATIAQDEDDNIFVLGRTLSTDFPTTPNAFDTTQDGWADCVIAKFDSELQNLLAATYLGGDNQNGDSGADILVAADGGIYVTGLAGPNFPTTPGAYAATNSSWLDAFVAKLSNDLDTLIAATYLGGDGADVPVTMALDGQGNVVVSGRTESWDFPTTDGAFDSTHNGGIYDGFLARLDPNLQTLQASTYVGGSGDESCEDMLVVGGGQVLVTGYTYSPDYQVTPDGFDTNYGGAPEAFVSRFDTDFTRLVASTFLGGTGNDQATSMALNGLGSVYVAGTTSSTDFPVTPGAYDDSMVGGDLFIAKLNLNLTSLHAATYFGGSSAEYVFALAVNGAGEVCVGGEAWSADFPTSAGSYCPGFNGGSRDAFVFKLDRGLADDTVVGVGAEMPRDYVLYQNNPNPFNPVTTVDFEIANPGRVSLTVYDLLGRQVAILVDEELAAGRHRARWDARTQASGMYFCRLIVASPNGASASRTAVCKMQLVR